MNQENLVAKSENSRPGLFRRLRKWSARLTVAGLLFTNVTTLVNASIHDFLYSGIEKASQVIGQESRLSNSPTSTKKKKLSTVRAKTKSVSTKISRRLATSISLNLEALPAMAIPAIGTATSIAVVGAEIYLACETMNDMNSLLDLLGEEKENEDQVCGQTLPSSDEFLIQTQEGASAVIVEVKETLGDVWKDAENVPSQAARTAQAAIDVAIESYNNFETSVGEFGKIVLEKILDGLRNVASIMQ